MDISRGYSSPQCESLTSGSRAVHGTGSGYHPRRNPPLETAGKKHEILRMSLVASEYLDMWTFDFQLDKFVILLNGETR